MKYKQYAKYFFPILYIINIQYLLKLRDTAALQRGEEHQFPLCDVLRKALLILLSVTEILSSVSVNFTHTKNVCACRNLDRSYFHMQMSVCPCACVCKEREQHIFQLIAIKRQADKAGGLSLSADQKYFCYC